MVEWEPPNKTGCVWIQAHSLTPCSLHTPNRNVTTGNPELAVCGEVNAKCDSIHFIRFQENRSSGLVPALTELLISLYCKCQGYCTGDTTLKIKAAIRNSLFNSLIYSSIFSFMYSFTSIWHYFRPGKYSCK